MEAQQQQTSGVSQGRQSGQQRRGGGGQGGGRGDMGGRRGARPQAEVKEFEQKILDLSRVTRVTAGGKRMSFRASLLIGDKKGRVGLGVAKGADVQLAVEKAYRQAKKRLVRVPLLNGTIPHVVLHKFGAAQVLLKPAPVGTGLKCGGAVRVVMELAGVPNVVSKVLGSSNKLNLAYATVEAIEKLRISERLQSSSTKTTPAPAASTLQVVPEEKKTIRKKTPVASKPKTTTRAPKKASSKTEDAA